MNTIQQFMLGACTFKRACWALAWVTLPLLSPAQVPPPGAAPIPPIEARNSTAFDGANTYMAAGTIRVTDAVKGNLYVAGGRITVAQAVQGNATLAGGAVALQAAVGGDLRVAGGDITLDNAVGGALNASGGNITLGSAAVVQNAAALYAGHVTIDGKVNGPLRVYAEKIVLNGQVLGDVELNAEEIELGPLTKLGGALRYSGNAQFKTAEGAVIGGAVVRGGAMNGRPDMHHDKQWHGQMMGGGGWAAAIFATLFGFVALLAMAALFLLVFAGFSRRAANTMQARPWPAFAAGLALLLGTPTVAILLCVTLIGIPLGIVLLLLWPLMLMTGLIVGIFCVAQRVRYAIQKQPPNESSAATMGFFALTLLLVLAIGSVPVIGGLLIFVLLLLGTGGCALELYRQVRPSTPPPASGASGSGCLPGTIAGGTP